MFYLPGVYVHPDNDGGVRTLSAVYVHTGQVEHLFYLPGVYVHYKECTYTPVVGGVYVHPVM